MISASWDTETNGIDFHHGAMPFFVTRCEKLPDDDYNILYWEWRVNPLTRIPIIPDEDVDEIISLLEKEDETIFQNSKFDIAALNTIPQFDYQWDYSKIHDTLLQAHLVNSAKPHDLTNSAYLYLGIDIDKYDKAIEEATKEARRLAKSMFKDWRIAKRGLSEMPSAKEKVWKYDMWLPREIIHHFIDFEITGEKGPIDHWVSLLSDYANVDTQVTYKLFEVYSEYLKDEGLWEIYEERRKLIPIIIQMESEGIPIDKSRTIELAEIYNERYIANGKSCTDFAKRRYDYDLELPKAAANNSLKEFCFSQEYMGLKPFSVSKKTKAPSLDKAAKAHYRETLEGDELDFMSCLDDRSKLATSLGYMDSYLDYMRPRSKQDKTTVLYSSLNPTGTSTLRWSSQNPNQQQISSQPDFQGTSLRYIFGPSKGRLWASLDYNNLELRIPAYEGPIPAMLELFENPNEPPYYGSYHLLVFDILHPEMFEESGTEVKNIYKKTWYSWTKNGNFADQYGAIDNGKGTGTADRAFHVPFAQKRIAAAIPEKKALNDHWIQYANEYNYIETLPDRTTNPDRGYTLYFNRTENGRILETQPLNYHVQGTACWIIMRAMIEVQKYLDEINENLPPKDHWKIVMQVHDELVLDFPANSNYKPKLRTIRIIMESIGQDLIPKINLTCGCDIHHNNWSEGKELFTAV